MRVNLQGTGSTGLASDQPADLQDTLEVPRPVTGKPKGIQATQSDGQYGCCTLTRLVCICGTGTRVTATRRTRMGECSRPSSGACPMGTPGVKKVPVAPNIQV